MIDHSAGFIVMLSLRKLKQTTSENLTPSSTVQPNLVQPIRCYNQGYLSYMTFSPMAKGNFSMTKEA